MTVSTGLQRSSVGKGQQSEEQYFTNISFAVYVWNVERNACYNKVNMIKKKPIWCHGNEHKLQTGMFERGSIVDRTNTE